MSSDAGNAKLITPAKPQKVDPSSPTSPNGGGYSSQEDDAPTRVFTKRATFSQDTTLPMIQATTRERERENDERRLPSYYVRDFGDKISPGYDEIRRQAGLRTDSTLTSGLGATDVAEPDGSPSTTMEIMHNWTQEVHDEEFIATINILQKRSNSSAGPAAGIVWIHVEDQLPSLERFERFFKSHLAKRVQPFVSETTLSLLNRVKTTRERKLVSGTLGRFLIPGVVRYSARTSETGNEDNPCLFLGFPYLALGTFNKMSSKNEAGSTTRITQLKRRIQQWKSLVRQSLRSKLNGTTVSDTQGHELTKFNTSNQEQRDDSPDDLQTEPEKCYHPPRTLLQSRYRLESTKKRDKNQSILTLTHEQLSECISRPSRKAASAASKPNATTMPTNLANGENPNTRTFVPSSTKNLKQKREMLYIPQIWSLSLSGDIMLTCGPISVGDLCSSALIRRDFHPAGSRLRHSIVRFIFENDTGQDDLFIYPADRCEWFFGLINKQRKVEKNLGKQTTAQSGVGHDPVGSLHYTLVYRKDSDDNGQVVDCDNWLVIQSEHTESHLDLYLEAQKLPSIHVQGTSVDQLPSPLLAPRRTDVQRSQSHGRSMSDPGGTKTPTSPRFLVAAQPDQYRGRSGSSSARSVSPMSLKNPAWPEEHSAFFEWPFSEEVTQNIKGNYRRTSDERVKAWLAKTMNVIYQSHGQDMDALLKPSNKSVPFDQTTSFKPAVKGSSVQEIDAQFFSLSGPDIIRDKSSIVGTEVQRIYSTSKQMLKLFVPRNWVKPEPVQDSETTKAIHTYWGLVDRVLDGAVGKVLNDSDLSLLSSKLDLFLSRAQRIHRGVWKMTGDQTNPRQVTVVESAVIYMPLANAFEHICDFFFDVNIFMSESRNVPNLGPGAFEQCLNRSTTNILKDFERAQRFLIQGGDESRYQKSLGPIVTPEGITILLLRRLSRGVYRNGTINVIEVFKGVVERLAAKVENSASRFLLLEINRVAEEIGIVLETLNHQKSFLSTYKDYLDPNVIENAGNQRKSRFEYEQHGIERISVELDERIKDCRELKDHVQQLADQNLQLVEGGQDDINKKLMLFTLFTIVFLPPSFVTSFFGMNLKGLVDTNASTDHFWWIAIPLTLGLLIISLVVLYQNWLYSQWCKMLERFTLDDID